MAKQTPRRTVLITKEEYQDFVRLMDLISIGTGGMTLANDSARFALVQEMLGDRASEVQDRLDEIAVLA